MGSPEDRRRREEAIAEEARAVATAELEAARAKTARLRAERHAKQVDEGVTELDKRPKASPPNRR